MKLRFKLNSEQSQDAFLTRITSLFSKDKPKERAFNYLRNWNDKFWEETEYRTKEFTEKLETELKGNAGVSLDYVDMGVEGARKLSKEQRVEVCQRATKIVNAVQIKELHEVIAFLAENIFNEEAKNYYLILDKLDEDWVDDNLRFKLLKALLEAIRSFKKITSVKIIVAMRTDLHYHMFAKRQEYGFQEEKYQSLYLPVRWTREQLIGLLDNRVRYMFRKQYTGANVKLTDILASNQVDKKTAIDYILERTFFRPREAIIFLNECIARAEGSSRVSIDVLRSAEVSYSAQRLASLAHEWSREYPLLQEYVTLVRRGYASFKIEDFTREDCEQFAAHILGFKAYEEDPVYCLCEEYTTSTKADYLVLLEDIMLILYQVGIIGVKTEAHLGRQWSYQDQPVLAKGQIKINSAIDVHKTFWAVLGLTSSARRKAADEASRNVG